MRIATPFSGPRMDIIVETGTLESNATPSAPSGLLSEDSEPLGHVDNQIELAGRCILAPAGWLSCRTSSDSAHKRIMHIW